MYIQAPNNHSKFRDVASSPPKPTAYFNAGTLRFGYVNDAQHTRAPLAAQCRLRMISKLYAENEQLYIFSFFLFFGI